MNGNIWLAKQRMKRCVNGVNNIKKGKPVTLEQSDALATLWHEITHNRNKKGNIALTKKQEIYMELANEFVARNTLSDFYKSMGGKLQHEEFTKNRESTGYNDMVRNYASLIELSKTDFNGVLSAVKTHLFNEDYRSQIDGLAGALVKNGAMFGDGKAISKMESMNLIMLCTRYPSKYFRERITPIFTHRK